MDFLYSGIRFEISYEFMEMCQIFHYILTMFVRLFIYFFGRSTLCHFVCVYVTISARVLISEFMSVVFEDKLVSFFRECSRKLYESWFLVALITVI